MREQLVEDADALAQSVAAMVRRRPGRLVGLTVSVAADAELAIAGIELVDITARIAPGPPRTVAMEFER
jgi:hypothetical protein